jgi:hypothetical protein
MHVYRRPFAKLQHPSALHTENWEKLASRPYLRVVVPKKQNLLQMRHAPLRQLPRKVSQ